MCKTLSGRQFPPQGERWKIAIPIKRTLWRRVPKVRTRDRKKYKNEVWRNEVKEEEKLCNSHWKKNGHIKHPKMACPLRWPLPYRQQCWSKSGHLSRSDDQTPTNCQKITVGVYILTKRLNMSPLTQLTLKVDACRVIIGVLKRTNKNKIQNGFVFTASKMVKSL